MREQRLLQLLGEIDERYIKGPCRQRWSADPVSPLGQPVYV